MTRLQASCTGACRQPSSASSARPYARDHGAQRSEQCFRLSRHSGPTRTTLSATLLGTARETLRNSTGSLRGRSILNVSTGLSHRTQASLLCPPRCIETTDPSASATLTKSSRNRDPPVAGIEHVSAQHQAAKSKTSVVPHRRRWTKRSAPAPHTRAGEPAVGRQTCSFSACGSSAPKTGSIPREGNAGFTTTESRWLSTQSSAYSVRTTRSRRTEASVPRRADDEPGREEKA